MRGPEGRDEVESGYEYFLPSGMSLGRAAPSKKICRCILRILMQFYALFVTLKGIIVTQHAPLWAIPINYSNRGFYFPRYMQLRLEHHQISLNSALYI